jgi:hypothetical protein
LWHFVTGVNADRPIVPLIPTPEASLGCCDVDSEEASACLLHSCAVTAVWERRREGEEELPGDGNNAFGFKGLLMKAYDEVLDAPGSAARCDVAL